MNKQTIKMISAQALTVIVTGCLIIVLVSGIGTLAMHFYKIPPTLGYLGIEFGLVTILVSFYFHALFGEKGVLLTRWVDLYLRVTLFLLSNRNDLVKDKDYQPLLNRINALKIEIRKQNRQFKINNWEIQEKLEAIFHKSNELLSTPLKGKI